MVTVFDDFDTARNVIENLVEFGFAREKIELVAQHIAHQAPEVETPKIVETTESELLDGAAKWGSLGAGTGQIAGLLTTFPGLALGMTIMGGVTGEIMGGMAGVDHAVNVDTVDLPSLDEYEQLIENGDRLGVVLGDHAELMKAEEIVKGMLHVRRHIHPDHGHEYHDYPAHKGSC
ncbi:MAG: hypothetical protein ACI87E_001385 [Mariniblastus sp.]